MATPREVALDHYSDRQNFVNATAEAAASMWSDVDPKAISKTWAAQVPEMAAVVAGAQLGVARLSDDYLDDILEAEDADPFSVADIDPAAFRGASDGRGLLSLLANPAIVTLMAIKDGYDIARALTAGAANLDMLVRTQVADAGRAADQVALTARPAAKGYVRMAVGKTCARCLLLSGRFYLFNAGFQRHPRCDCIHVPAGDARAARVPGPRQLYDDLTAAERSRAGFSRADQRALAEGADFGQVVNAKRGMYTAGGRKFTTEGTTRRGFASTRLEGRPRLTPDEIFRQAGPDRDEALRLLHQNGYLLEAPVPAPRVALAAAEPSPAVAGGSAAGRGAAAAAPTIRPVLEAARTTGAVERAFRDEFVRITGRDMRLTPSFVGSAATAREHAEGLLRGLERFPEAQLEEVTANRIGRNSTEYAHASGRRISFNYEWTTPADRKRYLDSVASDADSGWHPRGTGSPVAVAVHEFGHVLDIGTLGSAAGNDIFALVRRRAGQRDRRLAKAKAAGEMVDAEDFVAGDGMAGLISREISRYATKNSAELVAEAFSDVVMNGATASQLSREIFDLIEAEYRRGGRRVGTSTVVSASEPAPAAAARGLLPKPQTALTTAEQARVRQLVRRDPQIFATVKDRFGKISTSGNLSRPDADWLDDVARRERAFVEWTVQDAQIQRQVRDAARQAGQTVAEYRATVAARLKEIFDDKPIAVRVRDEAALRDILAGGRFKTQLEGARRAPGLEAQPERRLLGERIMGVAEDAPLGQRPIYGYVAIRDIEPALSAGRKIAGIAQREGQEDILSAYGRVQVILRSDVRARTTATVGDSLDELGFVRPAPVDAPSAESLGIVKLGRLDDPTWTRVRYVEAQIHGGVRTDEIAAIVFPEPPSAATIAAVERQGIPWRVLSRDDPALRLSDIVGPPGTVAPAIAPTAPPANLSKLAIPQLRAIAAERKIKLPPRARKAEILALLDPPTATTVTKAQVRADARAAARERNRQIEARGPVEDMLAEVDELLGKSASTDVMLEHLDALTGVPDADLAALRKAVQTGDRTKIRAAITRLGNKHGLKATAPAGKKLEFDPEQHELFGGGDLAAGTQVVVVRRGTTLTVDGETIVFNRAKVAVAPTKADLAAARAAERAARARQVKLDKVRTASEALSEVDELLHLDASDRALRHRINSRAAAGGDAALRDRLLAALDSGGRPGLLAQVAREEKKLKLAPIGRAGEAVRFDRTRHTPIGDGSTIREGAPVVVVRRGHLATVGEDEILAGRATVQEITEAEFDRIAQRTTATTPEDHLRALFDETPSDARRLGGDSAYTNLLTFADGRRAIEKVYGKRVQLTPEEVRHELDAEELGPLVLGALGIRAPAVVRRGNRLLMEEIDGPVGAELPFSEDIDKIIRSKEGRLLGLADVLMANTDRNMGNWILLPGGRIAGIDHGLAFQLGVRGRTSGWIWNGDWPTDLTTYDDAFQIVPAATNKLHPGDLAIIRQRLEALRPEFDRLDRLDWHDSMMQRLAVLTDRARGKRRTL